MGIDKIPRARKAAKIITSVSYQNPKKNKPKSKEQLTGNSILKKATETP
jgi:hypothetical protein